jgi:hypothetical protein
MKIKKTGMVVIVSGFVVLLVIAIAIGLSTYSNSKMSRVSLLTRYFRALAADDKMGIEDLTSSNFQSDLLVPGLKPGAYELYNFGETEGPKTMVQRFLLIVDSGQDGKAAYLADMEYQRKIIGSDIVSIRMIDKGTPVKP